MTKIKMTAVRDYLARGWRVTLCNGKAPKGRGWHQKALTEEDIANQLSVNPDLNVGVILGPQSGVIALDTDSAEAEDDLQRLFHGADVPATPTAQTQRGKHRYYAWDERFEKTGKAKIEFGALEILLGAGGKGAQAIAPPSVTNGFKRKWHRGCSLGRVEPATLPDSVIERLLAAEGVDQPEGNDEPKDSGGEEIVPVGERNKWLTSEAGILRQRGWDAKDLYAWIWWLNHSRCRPTLASEELKNIAENISKYAPDDPRLFSLNSLFSQDKWPELQDAALEGLAGEILEAIDPYTEADKVAVLGHLLAGFGILVGSNPHCVVQNDKHPARLNLVLVGKTSKGRKGVSWGAPRSLFHRIDPKWQNVLRADSAGPSAGSAKASRSTAICLRAVLGIRESFSGNRICLDFVRYPGGRIWHIKPLAGTALRSARGSSPMLPKTVVF